jgi:hypothetical protein
MNRDSVREAFEGWIKESFTRGVYGLGIDENGCYQDSHTREMFESWYACKISMQEEIDLLKAKVSYEKSSLRHVAREYKELEEEAEELKDRLDMIATKDKQLELANDHTYKAYISRTIRGLTMKRCDSCDRKIETGFYCPECAGKFWLGAAIAMCLVLTLIYYVVKYA